MDILDSLKYELISFLIITIVILLLALLTKKMEDRYKNNRDEK